MADLFWSMLHCCATLWCICLNLSRPEPGSRSNVSLHSFSAPIDPSHIITRTDYTGFVKRKEVLDARSGAHLGHVYKDGGWASVLWYLRVFKVFGRGVSMGFEPVLRGTLTNFLFCATCLDFRIFLTVSKSTFQMWNIIPAELLGNIQWLRIRSKIIQGLQ